MIGLLATAYVRQVLGQLCLNYLRGQEPGIQQVLCYRVEPKYNRSQTVNILSRLAAELWWQSRHIKYYFWAWPGKSGPAIN
jgi:hypothetical protein